MPRADTASHRPSRARRLLRGLVVLAGLAAAAAAAAVARRRAPAPETRPSLPPPPLAPPPPEPSPPRTREELYREAQALGVKGRSKMSKAELERALADHRR